MKYRSVFVGLLPVLLFTGSVYGTANIRQQPAFPLHTVADSLTVTTQVIYPSKCSRSTGIVRFTVSGGSGQYAYSLGGPDVTGLPAGAGFGIVTDNITGVSDTGYFDVPVVTAQGEVDIILNQPLCAGGLGNIEVTVVPGVHFVLPYIFWVTSSSGAVANPGALPPGNYGVQVADADSCLLPPVPFTIVDPVPIGINADVLPADCSDGGLITLNINGGTGSYFIDWGDINGVNNPAVREHLPAGRYHVIVYDSLFCKDSLPGVLVKTNCNRRDTFQLLVPAGGNNSFCIPTAPGFVPGETAYQLLAGNSSAFGNWSLSNNCLTYNAFTTKGIMIYQINLATSTPVLMLADTICIRVSIIGTITSETVYFTAQVNMVTAACGTIPGDIQQKQIFPLNVSTLSGYNSFGAFQLDAGTACIAYTAFETPQFFADSITLAVCDADLATCHTISYVPSVLPFFDCKNNVFADAQITLSVAPCDTVLALCVGIPYIDILNFNILDNAVPYTIGASGCDITPVQSYSTNMLPKGLSFTGGPYFLDNWQVNGVGHNGLFSDIAELLILMNQIDPVPGWYLESPAMIIGGAFNNTYSALTITAADNVKGTSTPMVTSTALGASLLFTTGEHTIIAKKIQTGCADTLLLIIDCEKENTDDNLLVYNGISPNGDLKNDTWQIEGLDQFPQNEVWVYNSWGNEVFHQKGYLNDWNGDWNGKKLPNGVYFYVVDLGNGQKHLKGNLTIYD